MIGLARATIAEFEAQPDVRDRILEFVDSHPDALEPDCAEAHLTASALVCAEDGARVLLHLHRKIGLWLQMGGHCDGDGDLARVALREAVEESGIDGLRVAGPAPLDLDIHTIRVAGQPEHLHLDVRYLVLAPRGAQESISPESIELRWFSWDEAGALDLDEGLRRMIASARAYLRA